MGTMGTAPASSIEVVFIFKLYPLNFWQFLAYKIFNISWQYTLELYAETFLSIEVVVIKTACGGGGETSVKTTSL